MDTRRHPTRRIPHELEAELVLAAVQWTTALAEPVTPGRVLRAALRRGLSMLEADDLRGERHVRG